MASRKPGKQSKSGDSSMKKHKRLMVIVGALLVLAGAWLTIYVNIPTTPPKLPYDFTVKEGSTLKSVARQLTQEGLLDKAWPFVLLVRLHGKAGALKAGSYQLTQPVSPLRLFHMITEGDISLSGITFIEGWTFKQMRQALDADENVTHDTTGLSNLEIAEKLGLETSQPEGLFFPDTYYFSIGMSDLAILKRANRVMESKLADYWAHRDPGLPYRTPYEALIMASIVEKETGQGKERPMIAGVFLNRLHIGMRLQTDPTVIYGMGESYNGNIRKQDLLTDSPYNTYTRVGLPPTPIAMPGAASIQAVLHPARSKALYFVSRGDGTHQFSATLEEHNRAVWRYQKP